MLLRLILIFTVLPLVELAILLRIGELIGGMKTFGLVIVTGVVGAALARHEGWRCWRQAQDRLQRGQLPTDSLLDGLLILLAGAVLITPGVITDAIGLALLVPPVRRLVRNHLAGRLRSRIVIHATDSKRGSSAAEDNVIDVDYRMPGEDRREDRSQDS